MAKTGTKRHRKTGDELCNLSCKVSARARADAQYAAGTVNQSLDEFVSAALDVATRAAVEKHFAKAS